MEERVGERRRVSIRPRILLSSLLPGSAERKVVSPTRKPLSPTLSPFVPHGEREKIGVCPQ